MFGSRKAPVPIPPLSEVDAAADRRRFPRVAMPVFFRVPRFRNIRAPVVDVSEGGLRVFSDEPLEVGSMLELELFLPEGEELTGIVRVAWIAEMPEGSAAKYDIGFELFDMSPSARAQLSDLLERETRDLPGRVTRDLTPHSGDRSATRDLTPNSGDRSGTRATNDLIS